MKLYITKAEDRDSVIVILARNGYTVRQSSEKKAGDKRSKSFVEVITDDTDDRDTASDGSH